MSRPSLSMIALMTLPQCKEVTETDLLLAVQAYAEGEGWLVHHERQSGHFNKYGKWLASSKRGFPDLVLARDGVVILAELKTERGTMTPEQKEWKAAGVGHLWKPRHASNPRS